MALAAVMQGEPSLDQRPRDVRGYGLQRIVVAQRPTVRIGQPPDRAGKFFALGEGP
jgi:hypothetical protein